MTHRRSRIAATAGIAVVFLWATYVAWGFKGLAQWFPLLAGAIGSLIALVGLVLLLTGHEPGRSVFDVFEDEGEEGEETGEPEERPARSWVILVGLGAFPILVAALGTVPAVVVWLPVFLFLVARTRWWIALVGTAAAIGVLFFLQLYIGMVLPGSVFVS